MPGYKHPCKFCGKLASVPSVEKLTQLGLKDAQNVETRLKLDKSDAAAVA
ncbi:MAG: hypothetical protein ABSF65_12175 [Candidatus Bathyarchaeia archaeon]